MTLPLISNEDSPSWIIPRIWGSYDLGKAGVDARGE